VGPARSTTLIAPARITPSRFLPVAVLPVPETTDLNEYSVVSLSMQPYSGKPDHSGDSVVRGPYSG
jgi:hypothetical protein